MKLNPHTGTLMQAYLPAFDPNGLAGLTTRSGALRWMGFSGLVTQPVTAYRRDSEDGPYSPLSHTRVDHGLGGEARLVEVNAHLAEMGIAPIGDFVPNHLDEQSQEVRDTLRRGVVDRSWFRVTRDREVMETWRGKTNIFGLDSTRWEPGLEAWRASTFYGSQWELDVEHPAVIAHLKSAAATMVGPWAYQGLRWDAIAYAAGKRLTTRTGEHEPAAFELLRQVRAHLEARAGGDAPLMLAEAGGFTRDIARWLGPGLAHAAYDFTWMPTLVHSLDEGDWTPLRSYWGSLPSTEGRLLRFLGSHDERQLRYVPFKDALIARHGGPGGNHVCFGGNGLTLPVRNLVPSEEAFVMLMALTVLSDGLPLVYQTDMGGWGGDPDANAHDVRDPNRCLVPWISAAAGGWTRATARGYRPEPEYRRRSVRRQMIDERSVMSRLAQLIHLRSHHPAFDATPQVRIASSSRKVEAFARVGGERALLVLANASGEHEAAELDLRRWGGWRARRLGMPSTEADRTTWSPERFLPVGRRHEVRLRPYGGEVIELAPPGV
ncbi:MAG TPA: alpha-amylase family glycosyl hydrolase [Baekduia sp.]|uniref:alpha-amylase family glycosyl hydrolase n=1 Tax=Baekduia sp. TaxID=2600305 RepID=UPI002D77E02E|nr:alpha-amylase family glycosyl hydrolase [Baekduia sp.]HET6507088.1 alpha-amylase family glycosyl hydrolase [Baekduia sp.]